ncbi:hypothetical protein DPMN_020594 [Dreissena polymorpha]|uniref:Uncharacterized protein n=1 Tax=Dreissena polymorpha TaxID=45954 RepID=A0A9D4SB64_DREPO|nr:hypothetical protein DPMN_020594 [Dreissena polymorpha]
MANQGQDDLQKLELFSIQALYQPRGTPQEEIVARMEGQTDGGDNHIIPTFSPKSSTLSVYPEYPECVPRSVYPECVPGVCTQIVPHVCPNTPT